MRPYYLFAFAAALLLWGCFKDVSYKTTYILKPLSQQQSGDVTLPVEGAQAFAYQVDTAEWTVASYADALSGVVTRKDDPSQRMTSPSSIAVPSEEGGDGNWLQMPLSRESQMVVVVDPASRLYAYTQQKLAQNLSRTYVSILFKIWKEGLSYQDGKWSFYNEFFQPKVTLPCYVVPQAQYEEAGELGQIALAKAYAYAADTTEWYIASYQDAVSGVITSKRDNTVRRDNPTFPAYKESDKNSYKMDVSGTPDAPLTLMVVAVDQSDGMYAYTKTEVDLAGDSRTFDIVFRPWFETWIAEENGWTVVDEHFAPPADDPQTTQKR